MTLNRYQNQSASDVSAGLVRPNLIRPSDIAAVRKDYGIPASFKPKGQSDSSLYSHSIQFVLDWWKKNHPPVVPPVGGTAGGGTGGTGTRPKGSGTRKTTSPKPTTTTPKPATGFVQPQTYPWYTSLSLASDQPKQKAAVIQPKTYPGMTSN